MKIEFRTSPRMFTSPTPKDTPGNLTVHAIHVVLPTTPPVAATISGVHRPADWVRNADLVALVS